jgi:diguanylate cyclase (GGDEF)-like protein
VTDEVRSFVWSKKVADYVVKDDPNSLDYIVNILKKLKSNSNNLVLVVDDSSYFRTAISELLYIRKYRVINALSGKSCLDILKKHPEIKLVITDYNMPEMNGLQLCQKIREQFKADKTAIIGVSSENDQSIGAKFIKSGANDFIVKQSFLVEEFYARVDHCLETINLFGQIRENSIKDFLTGLNNRRFFLEDGETLFQQCKMQGDFLACIMIDIDYFKKVNDTYGHDIGDRVIKLVADAVQKCTRETEIAARFGGEEFCILAMPDDVDECRQRYEILRKELEGTLIKAADCLTPFSVTISIGICVSDQQTLNDMIQIADQCLYKAKTEGRNTVVISDLQ